MHGRPGRVGRHEHVDRAQVVVVDDQPAPGSQGGDELARHGGGVGQVPEDEAGVDQVVARRLDRVPGDVVVADLEVRAGQRLEPPRLDLGGHDVAAGPDPPQQPGGDAAGAGADLQAAPARPDPESVEPAEGEGVPHRGARGQPVALGRGRRVEGVVGHVTVTSRIIPVS
ncbi:MAG TPA: hypothetical protein VFZ77_10960 [Acidimicrobiales bacterium]